MKLRNIERNKLKNKYKTNKISDIWRNRQIDKYGLNKLKIINFRCNGFKYFE